MPPELKKKFETEIATAKRLLQRGNVEEAFKHLEHTHVLGQRYVVPHIRSHWLMLKIGVSRRSVTEVWGQAARIVLGALGSAIGIVPTGNTGGTDISMFKRLPIDPELAKLLGER